MCNVYACLWKNFKQGIVIHASCSNKQVLLRRLDALYSRFSQRIDTAFTWLIYDKISAYIYVSWWHINTGDVNACTWEIEFHTMIALNSSAHIGTRSHTNVNYIQNLINPQHPLNSSLIKNKSYSFVDSQMDYNLQVKKHKAKQN